MSQLCNVYVKPPSFSLLLMTLDSSPYKGFISCTVLLRQFDWQVKLRQRESGFGDIRMVLNHPRFHLFLIVYEIS